ncbi:MAG TPA: SDR family oxidoreductase [Gemmatimonadales bacterium]|nr:SDR family oxidoreductase [Gemmatimonadales bacterium]
MATQANMAGRICVITGATRGIGRAAAQGLAQRGATVVLIARRPDDAAVVAREIARTSPVQPAVVAGDLSSQQSIRHAAEDLKGRFPHLHVLINNAAVFTRRRETSVDGLELQFAVNHLAYFLLTNLLLDQLRAGAPSRIVNVSSGAHSGARIDFEDLQGSRSYSGNRAYSQSKLANILFTYELARRLQGSGVTANCLHPGVIATRLLAEYMGVPFAGRALASTFGAKPEQGAQTIIYLATSPEVESVSGKYFENARAVRSSRESYDEATARRLWELSAEMTDLTSA